MSDCVEAAISGVGIARVFDYQVVDELRAGALVQLLGSYESGLQPVHLAYPRQGLLPLKVRAFIDWAAPRLRARCGSFAGVGDPDQPA